LAVLISLTGGEGFAAVFLEAALAGAVPGPGLTEHTRRGRGTHTIEAGIQISAVDCGTRVEAHPGIISITVG